MEGEITEAKEQCYENQRIFKIIKISIEFQLCKMKRFWRLLCVSMDILNTAKVYI